MGRGALLFVALIIAGNPAAVVAQSADSNWRVSYVTSNSVEQTLALVKVTGTGSQAKGEMVAGRPGLASIALKSVSRDGNVQHISLRISGTDYVFESAIPKEGAKKILGSMLIDGNPYPGWISATDDTMLDKKSITRPVECAPAQEARALMAKATTLRARALQSKDAEKKADFLKQAAEANKQANEETPRLYREVLAKYSDNPAVFEAALNLLRSAQDNAAKNEEVNDWAATAIKAAQSYGPPWKAEFTLQVANALLSQKDFAGLALEYARQGENSQAPNASPTDQVRALNLLIRALRKNDKTDETEKYFARVRILDEKLDREYIAKMPPFKGENFAGRKAKSERTVAMELFTGAMCPPCVAADLAFDVLEKTYKPRDLVLIQYHLHIPGADPLTNAASEARWTYYQKTFPMDVRGTPTTIFNGKPLPGGGGGPDMAEKKYQEYREAIDPLLEEPDEVKLAASATRAGDRIDISVDVSGLAEPGSTKKLRILLTEEIVHFAGSNKMRLHHNVVRAFPGGVNGKSLLSADSKHKASINLTDLRGELTKYLDNYEDNVRPFLNPARPLELNHLRVVAIVQDDITREILQATQVEVGGK
jgi:hypothetical protein